MHLAAAETIFRKLDGDDPALAEKARRYKTDDAFRSATDARLQAAGFSAHAVALEAQRLSLDVVLAGSRLNNSAAARQLSALRMLTLAQKLTDKSKRGA